MANAQWKRCERQIAARLGGRRVPVTGRGRGDVPDIAHPWLALEVKHRATIPAWLTEALTQARAAAVGEQLPVAVIHQAGRPYAESLVVCRLDDFTAWFGPVTEEGEES